MLLRVLQFSLYLIKMRIPGQKVSLTIYLIANFSFSLQLYERYFINRSKTLNFILIPNIGCQLSDVNYGYSLQNVTYQKVHFHLKNKTKLWKYVDSYQFTLNFNSGYEQLQCVIKLVFVTVN